MSIDLEQLADRYPDATKELLELTEALKSKELQREGSHVHPELGEVPLAWNVDDANRGAIDHPRLGDLEFANDERDEVCRHRHRVGERHSAAPVSCIGFAQDVAARHCHQLVGNDQRHPEHGFEFWFIETGECSAGVRRFELRGRQRVLDTCVIGVGRPVEPAQLVVQGPSEREIERRLTSRHGFDERDSRSLGFLIELDRPYLDLLGQRVGVVREQRGSVDVEFDRVQNDRVGGFVDGQSDAGRPGERC